MGEIILEDFEKTIEDVESEESDAQTAFDELKKETEKSTEKKGDEKEEKEKKIDEAKEALEGADDMHKAAMEELEKLQAMCVEGEYSWEERAKKREQEIEALKGALKILEEWKD